MHPVPPSTSTEPRPPEQPGRARWAVPLALLVGAFVVYALTMSHTIDVLNYDVLSANFGSWHLARTGSPWLDGVHIPFVGNNIGRDIWVRDSGGHVAIGRSPGVIAAAVPAYLLLGQAHFSTFPAGLTAALLTAGAVTLLYGALRRGLPQRDAVLCALVFGFTTPVWSVSANGMWPHTVTVFGICGMAWASATNRWWWVGLFGGITLWGRLHAAVIVAILGLLVGARRRAIRPTIQVGLVSGVFLGLMCLWTHWMYGTWNPTSSYDVGSFAGYAETHRLGIGNQLGFWVSPDRGILVWTPVIVLLLPALVRSWRELPDWSRALVTGGFAYTVLQGVLNRFSGAYGFYGYRLGLEFLACAAPALALATPRMGRVARQVIGPVIAVQLLAIGWGSVRDGTFLPLDTVWHDNAFAFELWHSGAIGWVALALAMANGYFVQRLWVGSSPAPAQPDEPVGVPGSERSGRRLSAGR